MRLRPFSIISRYLARNFLFSFLGVLTVLASLLYLFELVDMLRRTASYDNVGFTDALVLALCKMPLIFDLVLPFAVMIGAVITFWRMTRSHELVVIRAVGVSAWQFLVPILGTAFIIGAVNIMIVNPVTSSLYAHFAYLQESLGMRTTNALFLSQNGLWLQEQRNGVISIINAAGIRHIDGKAYLTDVSIMQVDAETDRFINTTIAPSARLGKGDMLFMDAWVMQADKSSQRFEELLIPTELTFSQLQENVMDPEGISFWNLPKFISFFEKSGFSAQKHRMYFNSLLVSPFFMMALVLVAATFSLTQNPRQGGVLLRVVGSVLCGFGIYFFSKLTYTFGVTATLPIVLSVWVPSLIFVLFAVTVLLHTEDG